MPEQTEVQIPQCRRCGTCCAKGGPALHQADREAVDSGKIPLRCLITIRQGEPAYDNIRRAIAPAATDIIKIKAATDNDATCIFLDQKRVGCEIYESRPAECRVLTCWDTRAIMAIYDQERLTRPDLLSPLPGLNDLVAEHQERCGYEQVSLWAERIKHGQDAEQVVEALLHAIRYDQSLRQVAVASARLDAGLLEFLFGRPLSVTIRMFRLKLVKRGDQVTIVPSI
jgi:Fe-S-cluster containining protein